MNIADKLTTIAENQQKVYGAGRQAVVDEFWANYQQNGNRTNYSRAFEGYFWDDDTFKPQYSFNTAQNCNYMFRMSNIKDLSNVNVDYSTGIFAMCREAANLTSIGNLDLAGNSSAAQAFHSCGNLTKVGRLTVGSDSKLELTFYQCSKLTDITFAGEIGQDLSLSSSPLNKASIESVLGCLSTTASGKTLTLKSGQVDTAFETSEGAADGRAVFESLIAKKTNWKFSY